MKPSQKQVHFCKLSERTFYMEKARMRLTAGSIHYDCVKYYAQIPNSVDWLSDRFRKEQTAKMTPNILKRK